MKTGRIAVIPARGGSKRVPRKNLRPFAGKPMIGYAIEVAQRSALFERVIVSTDDAELAAVARELGADVPFLRPAELADDFTPTVPVIAHAIHACTELGWAARLACCIYPAVPLLQPQALADALALLEASDAPYAFPVLAYRAPIQRALKRDAHGRSAPLHPEYMQTRTQDLPPAFHDAGQFYWGRVEAWLAGRPLHADACTLVCDEGSVLDIDTPADWALAEALYRVRREAEDVAA